MWRSTLDSMKAGFAEDDAFVEEVANAGGEEAQKDPA